MTATMARGLLLLGALHAASALQITVATAVAASLGAALLATVLDGRASGHSLVAGAIAAFLLLGPLRGHAVAAALFSAAIVVPRATRARSGFGVAAILMTAGAAGLATVLLEPLAAHGIERRIATWVAGAVLCALPLAVQIDDPLTAFLRRSVRRHRGTHRVRLLRALALRTRPAPATPLGMRRAIARAWEGLRPLIERDDRAGVHVRIGALERAHRSARRLEQAERRLDRDELRELEEELSVELSAFESAFEEARHAGV